jgi:hypothetical protein
MNRHNSDLVKFRSGSPFSGPAERSGWPRRVAVLLALSAFALAGCSGKRRDFAAASPGEATDSPPEGAAGTGNSNITVSGPPSGDGNESPIVPQGGLQPAATAGATMNPLDAGGVTDTCGDACSGECTPGAVQCASTSQRVECEVDGVWGAPIPCEFVCADGACSGECAPGSSECLSTTRFRQCSDLGAWSAPADCAGACVGTACGGECAPGSTRCASTTGVQTCDDLGQWGATTACQNACAGTACTGECVPAATRCSSETQLQVCSDQGQFLAATACPFACVNGACGGECSPGSGRCNPANGIPQFCSSAGVWQSQTPCAFVCSGSGTCSGECTPGSRQCNPASGVPQLCSAAGTWLNQTPCDFVCTNGACGGECTPGSRRCDAASGLPQLCSAAATWQNQAACPRGCQNGTCAPQLGPGLACASGNDCTTGFCTDGVCCQTQCNGVCAQCEAGTGACVTPATDPDCAPVVCASNDCAISSGNITTNLCRGRGQCKDQNDCNVSPFDRGTACETATSDTNLCDGSGNCVQPTLTCNGITGRPVGGGNACCRRREGALGSFEFVSVTETYGPADDCGSSAFSSPGDTEITCDGNEDCRVGTVCCLTSASGGSGVNCRAAQDCNIDMPFVSFNGVCASPSGFATSCPAGRICTDETLELGPGWSSCRAVQ